jgi:hypothetical protein
MVTELPLLTSPGVTTSRALRTTRGEALGVTVAVTLGVGVAITGADVGVTGGGDGVTVGKGVAVGGTGVAVLVAVGVAVGVVAVAVALKVAVTVGVAVEVVGQWAWAAITAPLALTMADVLTFPSSDPYCCPVPTMAFLTCSTLSRLAQTDCTKSATPAT